MQYLQILRLALGIAKQVQADHPDIPGAEKFGVMLDVLTDIVGAADVGKYRATIQAVVTLAVDAWKVAQVFGFKSKTA